jgi:hypothetical protein
VHIVPGLFVEKPTLDGGAHGEVVLAEPQPVDTPASPGERTVASTPPYVDEDPASEKDPCAREALPEEPTPEPEPDPDVEEPDPSPDVEPVPSAVPALAPVLLFEPELTVEPELMFAPEALPETFAPPGLDATEQAATNGTEIKNPPIARTRMHRSMRVRDAACQAIGQAQEWNLRATESFVRIKYLYRKQAYHFRNIGTGAFVYDVAGSPTSAQPPASNPRDLAHYP